MEPIQPAQPTKIRRDIASLSYDDQIIYYCCLHFQIFMKPLIENPQSVFIQYPMTVKIIAETTDNAVILKKSTNAAKVYPKNHYDTYITSHANCCEHVSEFFPYYHRNLEMNFEYGLTEAFILLSLGRPDKKQTDPNKEKQRIEKELKVFKQAVIDYEEHSKFYEKVLLKFHALVPSVEIAAHYWNCFNLDNQIKKDKVLKEDQGVIDIPPFMRLGFGEQDPFTLLFQSVYKSKFDQFNQLKRLKFAEQKQREKYLESQQFNLNLSSAKSPQELMKLCKDAYIQGKEYFNMYENSTVFYFNSDKNDLEKKVPNPVKLYQLINPDKAADLGFYSLYFGTYIEDKKSYNDLAYQIIQFEEMMKDPKAYTDNKIFEQAQRLEAMTSFEQIKQYERSRTFNLNPIPKALINYRMHGQGYSRDLVQQSFQFNRTYVSYCEALLNPLSPMGFFTTRPRVFKKISDSNTQSMEHAHNFIHNMQKYTMMDDNFSLTNPLFFMYHSWIDYMLELKIRLWEREQSNSALGNNDLVAPTFKALRQNLRKHQTNQQKQLQNQPFNQNQNQKLVENQSILAARERQPYHAGIVLKRQFFEEPIKIDVHYNMLGLPYLKFFQKYLKFIVLQKQEKRYLLSQYWTQECLRWKNYPLFYWTNNTSDQKQKITENDFIICSKGDDSGVRYEDLMIRRQQKGVEYVMRNSKHLKGLMQIAMIPAKNNKKPSYWNYTYDLLEQDSQVTDQATLIPKCFKAAYDLAHKALKIYQSEDKGGLKFLVRISYKTTIKNDQYPVYWTPEGDLKTYISDLYDTNNDIRIKNVLRNILDFGIQVYAMQVFGKGSLSSQCPNCPTELVFNLDLTYNIYKYYIYEQMRSANPNQISQLSKIWKLILKRISELINPFLIFENNNQNRVQTCAQIMKVRMFYLLDGHLQEVKGQIIKHYKGPMRSQTIIGAERIDLELRGLISHLEEIKVTSYSIPVVQNKSNDLNCPKYTKTKVYKPYEMSSKRIRLNDEVEYQKEEDSLQTINYLYQKVVLQWRFIDEVEYEEEKAIINIGGFTGQATYHLQFNANHTLTIFNPTGTKPK